MGGPGTFGMGMNGNAGFGGMQNPTSNTFPTGGQQHMNFFN